VSRILIRVTIVSVFAASVLAFGTPAQAPASAHAAHRAALVTKIKVTAMDIKFKLSAKTARRGIVVFKVTNIGALKHDSASRAARRRSSRTASRRRYGSPSSARATIRTSARSMGTRPPG
jgi:hypothetical protein